jgi:hypothetical protein
MNGYGNFRHIFGNHEEMIGRAIKLPFLAVGIQTQKQAILPPKIRGTPLKKNVKRYIIDCWLYFLKLMKYQNYHRWL